MICYLPRCHDITTLRTETHRVTANELEVTGRPVGMGGEFRFGHGRRRFGWIGLKSLGREVANEDGVDVRSWIRMHGERFIYHVLVTIDGLTRCGWIIFEPSSVDATMGASMAEQ